MRFFIPLFSFSFIALICQAGTLKTKMPQTYSKFMKAAIEAKEGLSVDQLKLIG